MTNELKSLIHEAEEAWLSAEQLADVKGGGSIIDIPVHLNFIHSCNTNIGMCETDKDCPTNCDACGPIINPLLKVTCRSPK